ncbi:MAG: HD domain-containing protein [Eubacteriales bacterium]|nr:HD domain-containing protein [Eubacteriales bacterium]
MKRLLRLQSQLLREIEKYEGLVSMRDKPIDWERVHMASCARLGYLMAQARGVDPELASCACAVHDYGRIISGKQEGHAEAGYLPGREFLRTTGLFSEEEIDIMAAAINNHSRKSEIGTPIEEIVKDADVIDFCQYGFGFSREEQKHRYERLVDREGRLRF